MTHSLSLPAANVGRIMQLRLLALLPGIAVRLYLDGTTLLLSLLLATASAWLAEAVMLRWRGLPAGGLRDGSATLTAWLLVLVLPAATPLWQLLPATLFAIVIAKQLYGGLGSNPFNPAMAGAAVLLCWHAPTAWHADSQPLLALGWLLGGALLWQQGQRRWQTPLGMLLTLLASSTLLWLWQPARYASPLLHLLDGNTLLLALFIITDPVSGGRHARSRLLFGAGTALLLCLLRSSGQTAHGEAFAVLLMNMAIPLLERHLRPAGPPIGNPS